MYIFPLSLIYFWYIGAVGFFLRLAKNTLLLLEEDLAVGLMLKLLFTPLFHDSSIIGRILSFIFRTVRIFFGFFAFIIATAFVILAAFVWFGAPVLLIYSFFDPVIPVDLVWSLIGFVLFGVVLHINQLINNPRKPVWSLKNSSQIWDATKLKKRQITFEKLIKDFEVINFLNSLEVKVEQFTVLQIQLTPEYENQVLYLAKQTQAKYLTSSYFFAAALLLNPQIEQDLLKMDLTKEDLIGGLKYLEFKRNKWRRIYIWDEESGVTHLKGVNRGWLGAPTYQLDRVSIDLTREASRTGFPDLIGRQAALHEVINILSQDRDRNVLLVGEPGSGKTALVRYLAKLIIQGHAPEALAIKRLVALNLSSLISGINSEGELAERIKTIFEEVEFVEDIIIFIEEIHELGVGEAGSMMNLHALLMPYLESSKFQFIASTEIKNYARIIEKNAAFARLFHKVEVPPATVEETIQIIQERSLSLLRHKKIDLTYKGIKELVVLSDRLNHNRVLPDSALDALIQAEVEAAKRDPRQINSALIKGVLEKEVDIPVLELNPEHKELLLNLDSIVKERIIDQDEAVDAVVNTLRRGATSLRETNRPIGSFLFVGPTGTGKTELAKTIAQVYFGDKGNTDFIRFDMSEYQHPESVGRLIGDLDHEGQLTESVKNNPYCLLLLDEFEKANEKILTLFLQVLEDGRLTDSTGRVVDFTNTIIIATSNAGSLKIVECLNRACPIEEMRVQVKDELLRTFRPELVNRFDSVVTFKPLSEGALEKIVKLKLKSLQERLKSQGYLIDFSPDLIAELVRRGYDPTLGARPLRRLIQDTIESELSVLILEDKLPKGEPFTINSQIFST